MPPLRDSRQTARSHRLKSSPSASNLRPRHARTPFKAMDKSKTDPLVDKKMRAASAKSKKPTGQTSPPTKKVSIATPISPRQAQSHLSTAQPTRLHRHPSHDRKGKATARAATHRSCLASHHPHNHPLLLRGRKYTFPCRQRSMRSHSLQHNHIHLLLLRRL